MCKFSKWLLLLTVQLAADPDPNVKNGAELLDRLIKVSNMTSLVKNSRVLSLLYVHVVYKITGIKNPRNSLLSHRPQCTLFTPPPPTPPPPRQKKVLQDPFFQFLLGITVVPREIQGNGNAKCWGVNKVHYGLCENAKLRKMIFQSVTQAAWKKKSKYCQ